MGDENINNAQINSLSAKELVKNAQQTEAFVKDQLFKKAKEAEIYLFEKSDLSMDIKGMKLSCDLSNFIKYCETNLRKNTEEKAVRTKDVSTNDKHRRKCYAYGSPVTKFSEVIKVIMIIAIIVWTLFVTYIDFIK